jgi:hypothetical protein
MVTVLTAFRPVVSCAALPVDKIIRAEEASVWARADGIHRARLKVDQDCTRNVLVRADLIVVHVDSLELHVAGPFVDTIALDTVLF